MRANYFFVAGASLLINLFAQSVIGVIDLRQRDPGVPKLEPKPDDNDLLYLAWVASHPDRPANGGGDTSHPADPNYAPATEPNKCLEGGECGDIIDQAAELIKELAKVLADAGRKTTTTTGTFVTVITPRPVPNCDVITAIKMKHYLPLLNTAEQQMWNTSRLCFFANMADHYIAAARATPKTASSAAANATPSATSPASLLRRGTSTLPPLSFSSLQSHFFASYMPSALVIAYGAPRNGPLYAATATCPPFSNAGSFKATCVYKAAPAATVTTPASTVTTPASNVTTPVSAPQPQPSSSGRVRSWGPWKVWVAAAGFLGATVGLLML